MIFDESYYFVNYGLNIFFERVIISIGLYQLESVLKIKWERLIEIEMFWDSLKILFDFVAEFSITFFIFQKYT